MMKNFSGHPLMMNNIRKDDLVEVVNLLSCDDPMLTQGKYVRKFEADWCEWLGCKYAVFVNSGASANYISFEILRELGHSGDVVLSPVNWISDIASIVRSGFNPKFVDIDLNTLSLDPGKALDVVDENTAAVLATHIQGFPAFDKEFVKTLSEKGIPLIEDVCESHGAEVSGQKCGSFGLMSNFSFYYAHHISTIEGGMICTNNPAVYELARIFRSHGMVREMDDENKKSLISSENPSLNPKFIFEVPGYNMRNTEIGGLIGISQLKRLDENVQFRQKNFEYFLSALDPAIFKTDFKTLGGSNYSLLAVLREPNFELALKLEELMSEKNIEFRRGSACGGNHLRQPYFKKYGFDVAPEDYPNSEHAHFFGYYLGNFPGLRFEHIDWLARELNSVADH